MTITNSVISGNHAAVHGGGLSFGANGSLTVTNTIVTDNQSGGLGGGLRVSGAGTFTLTNALVTDNTADGQGGGIYIASADTTLTNVTLSGNSATAGSAMRTTIDPTLNNSILVNNSGNDCVGGAATVQNTLVDDGSCGITNGVNGNLTGDPTLNGDFTLTAGSIAINAGNNNLIPSGITTDLAGNARIQQTTVDMGAYESSFEVLTTLTVDLTLQGRPAAPNAAYMVSGEIEIRQPNDGTVIVSTTFTADNLGRFTFADVPVGTVDIWIKGSHTLARLHQDVAVVDEGTLTTALLLEGDANDDNQVILVDFSLLAASFGTSVGNAAYDARADFNMDGVVNLIDFSLLASNFGLAGAP